MASKRRKRTKAKPQPPRKRPATGKALPSSSQRKTSKSSPRAGAKSRPKPKAPNKKPRGRVSTPGAVPPRKPGKVPTKRPVKASTKKRPKPAVKTPLTRKPAPVKRPTKTPPKKPPRKPSKPRKPQKPYVPPAGTVKVTNGRSRTTLLIDSAKDKAEIDKMKAELAELKGKKVKPKKPPKKKRKKSAQELVESAIEEGYRPTDITAEGTEYYRLIAELTDMSPHDIYTLFMSPSGYPGDQAA